MEAGIKEITESDLDQLCDENKVKRARLGQRRMTTEKELLEARMDLEVMRASVAEFKGRLELFHLQSEFQEAKKEFEALGKELELLGGKVNSTGS